MGYQMALARALVDRTRAERVAVGASLRVWRLRAGWTQTQLAERAGLHREQVARFELGSRAVSVEHVALIADKVGAVCALPEEVGAVCARVGEGL